MRFAEADQEYRNLENKLHNDEILEDDFLVQVAQLRVVDQEGRRWMVSPRTGRWMVHDGQQWVFADPPREEPEPEPEPEEIESTETVSNPVAATVVAAQARPQPAAPKPVAPRMLATGLTAFLLVACVLSAGISAWVFFLRDWGAVTPTAVLPTQVSAVQTYTPRPATATYTPTFTPTPSRTPTPTITPIPTDTPIPTETPQPTTTPVPVHSPTPTWTPLIPATSEATDVDTPTPTEAAEVTPTSSATSSATVTPPPSQTYTVKQGDTLFEIAQRFGVSVEAIAEANGITNIKLIRPGQVLVIPPPGTTPQPPTPTSQSTATPTTQATTAAATTPTPQTTAPTTVAGISPTPTATGATPTPSSTATSSGPTATPKPTNTPAPTVAPTSKPEALTGKIAFTVWNPYIGKYELFISRIDGEGRNKLGEGFRQPQLRQDGNLLAANGDGAPNYEHIVTMNPSGGELREVSQYTEDSFPSWSPDGAIVAYSSSSWGDGEIRLGIVNDMFGKQQDWIRFDQTEIRGEFPFWMSDGRVVYHGCDFMGDHAACGLYWVGAGGGRYSRLTTHQSDNAPAASGSRVAFMSARDGNWEIYTINIDGGGLKRLTQNNAQDGLPTFSPDGKSIAFVSNREGAWAIWVMNVDGTNQRKLFNLGGGYGSGEYDWTRERISWSP